MNIGILAYHAACNFGANLQLLSTVEYVNNSGNKAFVINWVTESLEAGRRKRIRPDQYAEHDHFRDKWYNETDLCRNAEDVARVIERNNIEAVIIGSDAVAQHHPLLSRINFPSRHIIINKSEDCMFPNVFWGTFLDYLKTPIPVAILSASSQNSAFTLFSKKTIKDMNEYVKRYSYISTRDEWTSRMYKHITNGAIVPEVTPDPVFAFNHNVDNVPTKEEILKKFGLPEKYIVFSFFNNHKVSVSWLNRIQELATRDGYMCVSLAFPEGDCYNHPFKQVISLPLNPIDWYCIIKYASGYVGHNMHPIVVALHNSVPFFSFDNYGVTTLRTFVNEKSSKIYHILSLSGFLENRTCDLNLLKKAPTPEFVYDKLLSFDKKKCMEFADNYYQKYLQMMNGIFLSFKK